MDWYNETWFDETHFPSKDEFDSSFDFGEGVFDSIISRFKWKRGGTMPESHRKTAHSYAHVYAFAKWNERLVLPTGDISFVIDIPFDEPGDHIYENETKRLVDILIRHGWYNVDTSYCFPNSEWVNEEYLLIYQKDANDDVPIIPDLNSILDAIGTESVLSHTSLYKYISDRFESDLAEWSIDEEGELAYTAAIETRLADFGWVQLGSEESKDRLWVEPDKIFDYLLDQFEGNTTISDSDLQEELRTFIIENAPRTKEGAEFDLRDFEDPFFRKIRAEGWSKIKFGDSVSWYRTEEAQKEALAEKVDRYGPILESPSKTEYDDQDRRNRTYQFFSQNRSAIARNDFYNEGYVTHQLRILEWYMESYETFEELHRAQTKAGQWTVIPNSEGRKEDGDQTEENETDE